MWLIPLFQVGAKLWDLLRYPRFLALSYKTAYSFCDKFNVTRSTYAQHESGGHIPKDKVLSSYSKKLEVSFDWLKTGKEEPLLVGAQSNKTEIEKNINQSEHVKSFDAEVMG